MKPKLHITDLAALIIIVAPMVYLYIIYPSLPAQVATHFNIDGKPDATGGKDTMWTAVFILAGASVFTYTLLRFLPRIDPKKTAKYSAGVFNKLAVAVVLLLACLNFLIINASQTGIFSFTRVMPALLGVFFIFMGNIMHSIKPNYFAGIRTPWTLESEETWRKTHQLGGKIWFAGGFVMVIAGLLVPSPYNHFVMIAIIFTIAIIPIVYSYTCYKSIQNKANQ